ncbi:LytR/AlgR family response regulator transcription factor [Parasporobacterium paucivorans]|uniref:Stage 0 sporulation protein A homolog n=1 Tax=Parasporobacterium paucivorans DSM 15970 TaxID=1122934 RepID=A0A1M6HPH9_9FIRM|nr:LytTR family DNA-binding domain-containing protein [Parasporobacterium paucivorans]SHJ24127.1 two component transcriptional regulator, LytTR family [Parasporobacterium paucivorans DSM 15970]
MKIALCDDDCIELQHVRKVVESYIESSIPHTDITLKAFNLAEELLRDIAQNGSYDLLILDIILPGMNGIELAAEIRKQDTGCKIIFLTSSEDFAISSYKVDAFYYILKPFPDQELELQLHRFFSSLQDNKNAHIIIRDSGQLRRVFFHSILYIESAKHTIFLHLSNGETCSCYGTMNEFAAILSKDGRFVKCHKSFVVNMETVVSISAKGFVLTNKVLIPISRQAYADVKQNFIDYFFGKG